MMREGVKTIAPYLVFVFFAAHFVAMFNWSSIGPIIAISGAEKLQGMNLPAPLLLVCVLLLSSMMDLFIGSATAKWSVLSSVVVPMRSEEYTSELQSLMRSSYHGFCLKTNILTQRLNTS